MTERAIRGWVAIAEYIGVSDSKLRRRYRQELIDAGVIFYIQHRPPSKVSVNAFPSRIQAWLHAKAARGEII